MTASAAAPNSSGTYYQNADGKKGSALKTALCSIIYNRTEKSYNYLWTAFQTTDVRTDGKIWDMYSNITNYTPVTSGSSYSVEGDCYNREHSFPQSWFGSNAPMYTDLHHIYPTDGFVNGKRANYPFGTTNGETYKSANSFSKLGTCTYSGYTGKVFEPADEYKGDFARTYFYMITCYEEKLHDWYTNYSNTEVTAVIDGSTYPGFQTWQLNMLLAWAEADPVSDKEVARNNAVYGIQGNRNPFIDYPGLEQYIWGSKTDVAFSYDNYVVPDGSSSGSGSGEDPNPGTGGEDMVDALNVKGWAGNTTNGYTNAGTDMTGTGSTTGVSYAMQVYDGSTGAVRGNQSTATDNFSCRNITTYPGYYIKEVKLTIQKVTSQIYLDGSTSGRSVVYFGTSAFTTSPTGTATASNENASGQKTLTWTNTDTSKNYFILYNPKTNGSTESAVVTVTWGSTTPASATDPSFNDLTDLSVNYGSTLTLTKGTTGTENFITNGDVTLSSLNENVVTVDGLTITPAAVGTAFISVNTSTTSAYNAGSVMFPITVNAPAGKTEAAPSTESVFTETFAGCTGKGGNDNRWSGTIADDEITVGTSTDNGGWSFTKGYVAKGCVKLGASKGTGSATTPSIAATTGSVYTLTFKAAPWDDESTSMNVTATGATISGISSSTMNTNRWNDYTGTITATSSSFKITFSASKTRFFLDDVVVTKAGATLTTTLNSNGYATYCPEYPLDFTSASDYSAWQITGVSGTMITFSQITGKIKSGCGILLKGEADATVTLTSVDDDENDGLSGNMLYGTLAPTYVAADEYYGLSGNLFVKVNAGTVSAGKALLPASALGSSEVKAFNFVFEDDDITGIGEVQNVQNVQGEIYNLAGQMINGKSVNGKLPKGIYIMNGKKILR